MQTMVPLYGFSSGGGSGGKIVVTAPAGATVTVSKDGKVKTKVAGEDGLAVFKGLDGGTWRVSLLNEGGSESFGRNVAVTLDYATTVDFFDGYLYNAGDEREAFTGGWYGVNGTLNKDTSCMYLNNTSTSEVKAYTRIPFDTTGYTTITVNCGRNSNYVSAYFGIASMDKTSVSKVSMPTTKGDMTLDISGYQGEYLLYFSCVPKTSGTAKATVYSVKIE